MSSKSRQDAPTPTFRLELKAGIAMGPGKAALLRAIENCGSVSAAAKELDMSYSRAWLLVKSMNEQFKEPLVELGRGGAHRGGASVTAAGLAAVELYETMQVEAEKSIARYTPAFTRLLK